MRSSVSVTPTHRELRWQAVRKGAGFGVTARVVSVACALAQVPIALNYLGAEGFGLWMTLSSVAGLLALGDFGLSLGAKTLLADVHGKDDLGTLHALLNACARRTLRLGLVLTGLGLPLAWLVDWSQVLGVTSPALNLQLPWALTGLALIAGASLPANLGPVLAAAVQLTWLQHFAGAITSVIGLAAVVACAALQAPWLVLVLTTLAVPALVHFALGWTLRHRLRPSKATSSRPASAVPYDELWRLSRWFFVPQAGSLFALLSVPVAIAATGGPAAVTAFNLIQRIFGLAGQVHGIALAALWPAYSEAYARQDYAWMRQAYRRSWQATLALFVPGLVLLATATPWLVQIWIGHIPGGLTPLLIGTGAGWFILLMLGQPPAMLLNGLGRVRGVALYGTAGHVVSLAGMIIGGRLNGTPGVVIGMASGYLLVGLPCILIETARTLRGLPG